MAPNIEKESQDLETLKLTVVTTSALITQLLSSTSSPKTQNPTKIEKDVNIDVLNLSRDSASLIRAHSTKLSLLIINKPFTASAIITVLRELVSGPLPGLVSAVELCDGGNYTKAMSKELQWRAKNVLVAVGNLIKEIPHDGQILSTGRKNGTDSTTGKENLASTGVVWEACDSIIALSRLGVGGLMVERAEEYRDLVKDALEELQEWGEEESNDQEEVEEEGKEALDDGIDTSAQDALDDMFASQRHIPADDPEMIRPRLDTSQKRLRLTVIMYQAVIKRRLKTLPKIPNPNLSAELKAKSSENPGVISRLDELLEVLKKITDIADELASAFYELDSTEIDKRMNECFSTGCVAVELLSKDWEGQQDEFSSWVENFQLAMKKGW